MPYQQQATMWVRRGHFLDLDLIPSDRRPNESAARFWRAKVQQVTNLRPIKAGKQLSAGSEIEFDISTTNTTDVLTPDSAEMVMQCAFGLFNDFRAWMEQPVDTSMRRLPDEVPTLGEEVGQIRMWDSPYDEPQLDETEFWIIKDEADTPTIHASKKSGERLEPVIAVKVNKLIIEEVTARSTIDRLADYQLPSTPVYMGTEI